MASENNHETMLDMTTLKPQGSQHPSMSPSLQHPHNSPRNGVLRRRSRERISMLTPRARERSREFRTRERSREFRAHSYMSKKSSSFTAEGMFGDDELSDHDKDRPQSFNAFSQKQSKVNPDMNTASCSCMPDITQSGLTSMIYTQSNCKHSGLFKPANIPHRNSKNISKHSNDNWFNSGKLPSIHKTDFISRQKPVKHRTSFSMVMGYPKVPAKNIKQKTHKDKNIDNDNVDADDEGDDNETDDATLNGDRSDKEYFLGTPRVVLHEGRQKHMDVPHGYMAGDDEIPVTARGPHTQHRRRLSREHIGN